MLFPSIVWLVPYQSVCILSFVRFVVLCALSISFIKFSVVGFLKNNFWLLFLRFFMRFVREPSKDTKSPFVLYAVVLDLVFCPIVYAAL